MIEVHPYLSFNGKAEQAFQLYQRVLGGTITMLQRFGDVGADAGLGPIDSAYHNYIIHMALELNDTYTIMGCDIVPGTAPPLSGNSATQISINLTDNDKAKHIFNELSLDGTITMPFDKMFWGSWYGMLTDQFGIQWMVDSPVQS